MIYLNEKQIRSFAKKYLTGESNNINKVSLLKYGLVKEYLADDNYLVVVKLFKTIIKIYK